MKILILYRELAGYTLECLNKLAANHELLVVHYPVNKEAPFNFEFNATIRLESKSELTSTKIVQFNPNFILCSGWSDLEYIDWVKALNKPTALAFDTIWQSNLKFVLGSFYFKLKYKRLFQFAFIPGKSQMKTAKNLGFPDENIFNGFYSCEDIFRITRKPLSEKKELWCIARYIPKKNLNFLCETFLSIMPNERSGWTLNIAGTGELFPTRIEDDAIVHHGFIQPKELSAKLENAAAFVLPSLYEPWGVVVHEMATLGKPLILSKTVGAKQDLLEEGKNGYSFNPHSKNELKHQLLKIFNTPLDALQDMGNVSAETAKQFSSDIWVSQFTKMLNDSCAE